MKNYLLLFGITFLFNMLHAQNKITGKITDENKNPLAGVSIFVPELNKQTLSDEGGNYEILNLPNGRIRIQFSMVGYTTMVEVMDLNGGTVEHNVMLKSSSIEVEEVVVSAGYSTTQHENAVKIDVLKLDPLKNINSPNFTQLLTQVPGIDMISKGSGVSKPVIRGLSMNDILVLNNGVRFENYQYSDHHPLGIDESGIGEVEIIKGPASLLYGSDAIGGVINFLREKPAPVDSIMGDYNLQLFSNTLGMNNNLGIKGAGRKVFGGIRIGQKTHADFLQGGGDFAPNSRFNEMSVKADAGITGNFGVIKLFYDYSNQKLGLPEEEAIEQITERGRKNKIFYQEFNTHLLSSQNRFYLGQFKLDVNSAFQNTNLLHVGEANVHELEMALSTLTYDVRLLLPSEKGSEYIVGLQGFNQINSNRNGRETILLPDANMNNYAAYGMIQKTLVNKLVLQTGIRYDFRQVSTQAVGLNTEPSYRPALKKSYSSVSGSLGATYSITEKLLVRFNLAKAYRTPNMAELTSNGPHELRYELGDQNLVPQNAYETDLSMHYHADNFTFDIAGFYNVIENYIFIAPTGDTTASGLEIYKYQQANSALYGGEFATDWHPEIYRWLHLGTSFSWVIGKRSDGSYLPFVPAHKLRFEARAEKNRLLFLKKAFFEMSSCIAFRQNLVAPNETATKGYTLFDISMGGNIGLGKQQLLINLSITNLLDTKYVDHLSTLKEVNLFNPGRNVSLSLKVPFGM